MSTIAALLMRNSNKNTNKNKNKNKNKTHRQCLSRRWPLSCSFQNYPVDPSDPIPTVQTFDWIYHFCPILCKTTIRLRLRRQIAFHWVKRKWSTPLDWNLLCDSSFDGISLNMVYLQLNISSLIWHFMYLGWISQDYKV